MHNDLFDKLEPRTKTNVRVFGAVAVFAFCTVTIWPLALVWAKNWTLTGLFEEPIGYRYFYSLRSLYDVPEYLFLPQGQFSNLIHKAVQIALTASGVPITQLFPRIDYFAILSVTVFLGLAICAFVALSHFLSPSQSIASAAFWCLPFYMRSFDGALDMGFTRFGLLIHCDYLGLYFAVAIATAAGFVWFVSVQSLCVRHAFALGIFTALCVTTKITLIIYPGILGGLLIDRSGRRSAMLLAIAIPTAAALAFLILLADQGFSLDFTKRQISDTIHFLQAGGGAPAHALSGINWFVDRIATSTPQFKASYLVLPIGLAAACVTLRRKLIVTSIAIVIAAVLSFRFLYVRDYSVTILEVGFFVQLCGFIALYSFPRILAAAGAALLVFCIFDQGGDARRVFANLARNTEDQNSLQAAIDSTTGRLLWVVPKNELRPNSVHSAIMKGGSNESGMWKGHGSKAMAPINARYDFRFMGDPRPVDLANYGAVLFVPDPPSSSWSKQISTLYGISPVGLTCSISHFEFNSVSVCRVNR